ncbi:MAG: hypothetical protein AAFP97_00480 [Pseudomonadota bacterium]
MTEKNYEKVQSFLNDRSPERVKALRVYALTNQEQASAALRMTIVINVSIPVIFMTLSTQISDGRFWDSVWDLYASAPGGIAIILSTLIAALVVLFIILVWGASRLGEARDIRHLIDLYAAERGIYFGLEDADTFQSE